MEFSLVGKGFLCLGLIFYYFRFWQHPQARLQFCKKNHSATFKASGTHEQFWKRTAKARHNSRGARGGLWGAGKPELSSVLINAVSLFVSPSGGFLPDLLLGIIFREKSNSL